MKVFSCEVQGCWAGGLIVVAANTKEEAYLTAARDIRYSHKFCWADEKGWCGDDGKIEHCRCDSYPFDKWQEETLLTANVETPQVIIEDSYCE